MTIWLKNVCDFVTDLLIIELCTIFWQAALLRVLCHNLSAFTFFMFPAKSAKCANLKKICIILAAENAFWAHLEMCSSLELSCAR